MIEFVSCMEELTGFQTRNLYSVRILSLANAYGFNYNFIKFYRQISENDKVTAIFSMLDRDITLAFENSADIKEIREFVSMLGFTSLLCDAAFDMDRHFSYGAVMKTAKKIEIECSYTEINEYPYLLDLFNFVDYGEISFESWYVDISHRIRHNAAKAVTLNINDEIISSAVFSSIYNDDAILSAVRTADEHRNKGYGSALVSAMCCDVRGTVYLMRDSGKNEEFYKKLGFENCGGWKIYK